ncbi:aldehyde dehydrogenase (NADP(+)) [Streptomyces sp. RB6PN25]|uniref:Aldehyde dehydrogenase (NADP(+)) n=1 Tax=Streptomyces humicola TaxID=2953240 RepID=A0ABT1Q7T9_9ACTN|nr:aldehyde dehydrogenase (NADP(+)) [Streptomyces humicola]MCQ4084847.1 aldehyde dehydrogenase (NADP(+)) [Streptomyces humicola]
MTTTQTTDIEPIVETAATASHAWAATAPAERAVVLSAIADALDAEEGTLVPLADAETHLGRTRLSGELRRTTFQLRFLAQTVRRAAFYDVRIDRADETWPPGPRPELRRYRTAIGPVLVFAASNFPFAFSVAGGDTASAWAAGCPVTVKAHPGHPRLSRHTARTVSRAIAEVGAPAGLFSLIEGEQAGVQALRHPRIRAAAFTGSITGGLTLARIAAERPEPIPFYGELGSINPVVVTPGAARARIEEIALGYVASLTQGAGQFCTNPGLLFVPADSPLAERVAELLHEVAAAPMLNQRIADAYLAVAHKLATRSGMQKLCWPQDPASLAPRLLHTTLEVFRADQEAMAEECFGPLGVVVSYDNLTEVTAGIVALPGQLTTTVHAEEDEARSNPILALLADALTDRSGRVIWGGWPTGVAVTHAMHHGGPFPATTTPAGTSVGTAALERFLRPVAYQSWPQHLLPPPLRDDNPWGIPQHRDDS